MTYRTDGLVGDEFGNKVDNHAEDSEGDANNPSDGSDSLGVRSGDTYPKSDSEGDGSEGHNDSLEDENEDDNDHEQRRVEDA